MVVNKVDEFRFEDVDKRISAIDKRFDDLKWYMGGAVSLFAIGFSVLTLVLSWNLNSDKEALRTFQRDLRADLGKLDLPPQLEVFDTSNSPLNNQEARGTIATNVDGSQKISFDIILRNSGDSSTGPLYLKLYSNAPVHLAGPSTDEPKFKYEAVIIPQELKPSELPGRFSINFTIYFTLEEKLSPGRYSCLLKAFYGKGKSCQAPFVLAAVEAGSK